MKLLKIFMDWYRYEAPATPVADGDRVSAITCAAWEKHRAKNDLALIALYQGQAFHYYRAGFFGRIESSIRLYFSEHGDYPSAQYVEEHWPYPTQFGKRESRKEPEKEKYSGG